MNIYVYIHTYIYIYDQLGNTYILHTLYIYIYIIYNIYIYYIYIIYIGITVYLVYVDILNTCLPPLQLLFPRSSIYNILKVCYNN